MTRGLLVALVVVGVVVAYGLLAWLVYRLWLRHTAHGRELGAIWEGADRARRRRIARAVRRGQPVSDPRDAELAVRWAEYVQNRRLRSSRWRRVLLRFELVVVAIALFYAVTAAATHHGHGGSTLVRAVYPAVVLAGALALRRRYAARARRSAEANRRLKRDVGA